MTSRHWSDTTEATEACARLGRRLGMGRLDPVVLHLSQHVNVRLHPHDVVARGIDASNCEAFDKVARELEVARHLVAKAAPIVPPSVEWPAGPHIEDGFAFTLWTFVPHVAANEDDSGHVAQAAEALLRVHPALSSYRGQLPPFRHKVDRCARLLESEAALPALPAADRVFLLKTYDRLWTSISRLPAEIVPIHGDAHFGNVLITPNGARWNDFEDVCIGPREWEVGWFPQAALTRLEALNRDLLSAMGFLRSLCVSVWCWELYDLLPQKREAAEYHLNYLKSSFPP